MIVICEDCGRKYKIDPGRIKGESARFKCKACGHIIIAQKPKSEESEGAHPPIIETGSTPAPGDAAARPAAKRSKSPRKRVGFHLPKDAGRIGLRTKMFVLFFALPIILFTASSAYLLREINQLSDNLTANSTRIVSAMAEDKLVELSRSVAMQCRLYLLSHRGLRSENFQRDPTFKRLAVQKVGLTGYTALYEIPGADGVWRTWSHINPKIIGIDMQTLRNPMGTHFTKFWQIYTGVKDGTESKGYYTWKDADGSFRQKFMVCTPLEGTPYVIAATAYIDELTKPVLELQQRSGEMTENIRQSITVIVGVALVLVGLIVSFYGHRLTGKIKSLTQVADRISVGELDAQVGIRSKDELGDLAEAIIRMQESIRLSIERLRKRR